jgi:hypothetical protein
MDRSAKILLAAAEMLEAGVWAQGGLPGSGGVNCNEPNARCAGLAVTEIADRYPDATGDDRERATQRLLRHLGLQGNEFAVYRWNDAPGRTKEEVVSALRAAAEDKS